VKQKRSSILVPKNEGPPGAFDSNDESRDCLRPSELAQYRNCPPGHACLAETVKYPELSGIVLSLMDEQGCEQDGFLNLKSELYNLKTGARPRR
jgi:hypothetical protein